jgi:site-specific DNA recombinase
MTTNTIKFFISARKSTDVEDKQVLSIDAQLAELREFAARERLTIVGEYIEKQSAKMTGRPIFNQMMDRIEAGEANGILAWHPDRLSRNGVDGGRIIDDLDTGKLLTLKFPSFWFENTPQGKFMLSMAFSQSKYYVDALSENTKRGLREKVRRGEFPSVAPFGYLNDYRTKQIIVDRERAPIVKEMFERYATGTETLDTLRQFLSDRKKRSANDKLVGRSFVSRLLSNPFYYGHFRYNGEIHEGKHEPIISKKLFDEVQTVLNRRWRKSPAEDEKIPKAFLGLLHCADCGGAITAEIQKGHTYYRCTKKNRMVQWCAQPYVREEALDLEISGLVKSYSMRSDWAEQMLAWLEDEKKGIAQSSAALASEKRAEIEKINLRLQRLLGSFLDGVVERNDYTAEKAKLMSRKKSLEEQSSALLKGKNDWLEPFQNWIKTARNAGEIALTGSLLQKRVLALEVFGSNLVLDRKKTRGCAVKAWPLLVEKSTCSDVVPTTGLEPV